MPTLALPPTTTLIELTQYAFLGIQWLFLLYFVGYNGAYMTLITISFVYLLKYGQERELDSVPHFYGPLLPSISILVPAYNESQTITASVLSLLDLMYPNYDVIVINDGSKDNTMGVLRHGFDLEQIHQAYTQGFPTQPIQGIYQSRRYPNLKVIDKANGGKADALNAGIYMSKQDLVCCVDADSVLQPDSLLRIVQPFIENPECIAAGGTIRISNGCEITGSMMTKIALPNSRLAMIQIVEYLRAFLFGRMGWSPLNALLIISGAFSMFRRDVLLQVGGYRTDTVGEDMELIVRLHLKYRTEGKPYHITFIPDPICWTEAPEDIKTLRNQRIRWQRGLLESLYHNRQLLFHPKSGLLGWIAFPFMLFFEAVGPLIELFGMILMTVGFLFHWVSLEMYLTLLLASIGLGFMLSLNALLLEEISFHVYKRFSDLGRLFFALLVENMGYRQLTMFWRLRGTMQWLSRQKGHWGEMTRKSYS